MKITKENFHEVEGRKIRWTWPGLTKREYFAAKAMVGVLASESPENGMFTTDEGRAAFCVRQADALLAELAK